MGECPLWVVLSGVVTLLLGLIILNHWPVSSFYILGLDHGFDLCEQILAQGIQSIGTLNRDKRHAIADAYR